MAKGVTEQLWKQAWRPAAAYLYLTICFADFIAFPIYYMMVNKMSNDVVLVEQALRFKDGASQVEVLKALRRDQTWTPITTAGAGMIHLAFGSILGVAAWTRGQEKIVLASQPTANDGTSDQPPQA